MTLQVKYNKLENDCFNPLTVDPNPPHDLNHFSLFLRLENTITIHGANFDGPALVGATTPGQIVGNYKELELANAPARPLGTLTVDGNSVISGTDLFGSFTGKVTFRDTSQIMQKVELTYMPKDGSPGRSMVGYTLTGTRATDGTIRVLSTVAVGGDAIFDYGWLRQ